MPLGRWDSFPVRQERPPLFTVLRQVSPPTLGAFEEASWRALGTAPSTMLDFISWPLL